MKHPLLVCLCLAFCFQIHAQIQSDSVVFYKQSSLDSLLKLNTSPGRVLARSKDDEAYLIVIRTTTGNVEVHENWDDVAIVRSGNAILRTGTKFSGAKESVTPTGKEWLGGEIEKPTERKIAPGDFIVIPAGLAHQYVVTLGETFTYWTIKVKRPKR